MMTYWKNIILFGIKSACIEKELDSDPVYYTKFLETKIDYRFLR